MKLKSSLHRTAIVLAGAVLGLAGVTAAAGPASAHNASVTGTASCANGKSVVTWKFNNDYPTGATVQDLQLPAGAAPKSADGSDLHDGLVLVNGNTEFTQVVDAAPTAKISFTAYWAQDGYTDSTQDNKYEVQLDSGCRNNQPPPPAKDCTDAKDVKLTHTFAVDKDGATTIINLNDTKLCEGTQFDFTMVSYYAPKPQFEVPQYLYDKMQGHISNDNPVLKLHVKIPPCYTQVDTVVGLKYLDTITANGPRYGDLKLGSETGPGSISTGPHAWYNGGSQACVTPASSSVPACDGSQTVNLSNNGRYEQTFTVKYGDQVKTVTVPGGKGVPVAIPAGAGTVTVSAEGMADQTYNWSAPKTCAPPTVTIKNTCKDVTITVTNPKGNTTAKATVTYGKQSKDLTVPAGSSAKATFTAGSAKYATVKFAGVDQELRAVLKKLNCTTPDHPSLPITGAAAGTAAGGAGALLAAGGVLFFVARRRKLRFTA